MMDHLDFLKRVESHQLTILKDDGIYKHLKFRKPDTSDTYFDLMFFPNHAVIVGDMGAWSFSRVEDMMRFFRGDSLENIDFGYWKEKVESCSRFGAGNSNSPFSNFDFETFKESVIEYVDDYFTDSSREESEIDELKEDINDNVFNQISPYSGCKGLDFKAYEVLNDYSFDMGDYPNAHIFQFEDIGDIGFTKVTPYFLFACFAMRWGIQQYDKTVDSTIIKE